MFFSSGQLIRLLSTYKYGPLVILAGLEGPFVTILAGYLVSRGVLILPLTYAAVVTGDLLADLGYYAVGRYGRGRKIEKWIAVIGLTPARRKLLEKQFQLRGSKLLLMGKAAHGVGGAILVAAGLAKMPFWRFAALNFFATIIKSALLIAVGYRFDRSIQGASSVLDIVAVVAVTLSTIALIYYLSIQQEKEVLASV